jgi:hypothetical protein
MLAKLKACFGHLRQSRTILAARLYALAGAAVGIHDQVVPLVVRSGVDWKPLVPPHYLPHVLIGTAILFETLRWATKGPVGAPKDAA